MYVGSHHSLNSPGKAARPHKTPVLSKKASEGTEPTLHIFEERRLGKFSYKSSSRVLGFFSSHKESVLCQRVNNRTAMRNLMFESEGSRASLVGHPWLPVRAPGRRVGEPEDPDLPGAPCSWQLRPEAPGPRWIPNGLFPGRVTLNVSLDFP